MSVVVWDGQTIAADSKSTDADMRRKISKLLRLADGTVLAYTGGVDTGLTLLEWYKNGAIKEEWPKCQSTDRWSRLIVADSFGIVIFYETEPYPIQVKEPFMAWGSGRDFAMGALEMGANAVEAVEVAIKYCVTCGGEVESVNL